MINEFLGPSAQHRLAETRSEKMTWTLQLGKEFRYSLCLWYFEQHLILICYSNSILFQFANGKVASKALHLQYVIPTISFAVLSASFYAEQ